MADAGMKAWAKMMIQAVNSEAYSQASGAMLDTVLTTSAPFRETVQKIMLEALHQFSMPSRDDVLSLAERLANIELKLDDVDAKLDELIRQRRRTPKKEK
jgi:hypothetical protein